MIHYQRSKSGLFLMELMLNILLFCILCGYGLMFFIKSNNLSNSTTVLLHAVNISSSVANIYESGDGSLSSLCKEFSLAEYHGNRLCIYFDSNFQPCRKTDSACYVFAEHIQTSPDKIRIDFYDSSDTLSYSIVACHYESSVLQPAKEVSQP